MTRPRRTTLVRFDASVADPPKVHHALTSSCWDGQACPWRETIRNALAVWLQSPGRGLGRRPSGVSVKRNGRGEGVDGLNAVRGPAGWPSRAPDFEPADVLACAVESPLFRNSGGCDPMLELWIESSTMSWVREPVSAALSWGGLGRSAQVVGWTECQSARPVAKIGGLATGGLHIQGRPA